MYNTTNVFDSTVRGDGRRFIAKIKCGKNESTDAIKSLKQYSQLPSDSLTIGGAFPSTLELTLWNPGFSLQNKEFQVELGLEIEDGTTEWCPMGYYTSETFKESSDGMITITAYDRIYSKMSGAYFSELTYPADAIDVLNEISKKTGVEIQTTNPTSGVKIQKRKVVSNKEIDENGSIEQVTTYENPFDGYTYREALGYIAMLFCKYAIADRDGSVKLVWFNEIENYKVTADYYYELTTDETAFSIGKITCNTGEKEFEVGSGVNNIRLENPIMTQERLNYIYEVAKTLTFIPSYFPFYGDMRLDIGDVIKVVKTDGSIYSVPIMSVTQEFDGGLRTSVQSFGGLEQEVETKGPLATRLERQYTELLLIKELVGEKASFDNLYALSGEFGSLKADYGEFEKLVSENFESVNANIKNINSNNITADNIEAKLVEIGTLTVYAADLKYATIANLNTLNGKFEQLEVDSGEFENLVSDSLKSINADIEKLEADSLTVKTANLLYATIEDLNSTNSNIKNLTAKAITTDNLSASVAKLGYLTVENAELEYAKIKTLEANYLKTKDLSAESAKLGYLSADTAKIEYAKIDFSNVGSQVVSSSMIMDGAVTNEKVGNLSANKITSGTIDASMIRVINLNADNLTVGTINGKLIGNGSVDLDKLSEEVPTKEYLDNVQKNLQGQIDGAIETFTKAEIPTLNNEPASLWVDNATKDKHIGDICYVVNPTSSADGYCYRFADLGTNGNHDYSWVLIKDNDVTKALQDIIDINGEITGIKKFDVEISAWKTDTEEELSSLKEKTTTLETDIGNKVETKVFNEVKQTVEENSSKIVSLTTTVSKKADSSTVTTLTNNVNEIRQTATQNTASISGMKADIEKKADGSTVSSLATKVSSVEQNLDGFKTTVSDTYATKTALAGTDAKLATAQKELDDAVAKVTQTRSDLETAKKNLSEVTSRVGATEEDIEAAQEAVDVAQAAADKAKADAATAQATADKAKSTADGLVSRISSAESNITQLSNRITTEVSERTALGTKVSSLEQTASGLTVRLNSTESTANTALTNANKAQSSVDNLEIGGRNLARKTSSEWSEWWTPVKDKVNATFTVYRMYPGDKSVGDTFIVSFDIEVKKFTASSVGTFAIRVQGSVDNTWSIGNPFTKYEFKTKALDGDYTEHVSYACKINNEAHANATVFDFEFRCDYSDGTGKIRIKNFKLERGTKATDWTPAPEDVEADIDAAQAIAEKAIMTADVEYYLSTSPTSLSGGSWTTTAPTWSDGKYMWSRTVTTDGKGNKTYSPSQNGTCIAGATGATGATGAAGKGISSIVEQYYLSTSPTSLSGGSWTTIRPTATAGMYIWTRSVFTYTDGSTKTTDGISVTGDKGAKGDTGAAGKDANQVVHSVSGAGNSNMYINFLTLKITSTYVNTPISFRVVSRGYEASDVQIMFDSVNGTDPALIYIRANGTVPLYIVKASTSTWHVIMKKNESYGSCIVNNYYNPVGVTATWTSTQIASLPSGYIKASCLQEGKTATNYMNFSSDGLVVGDMTATKLGKNVLIDTESVNIRNGETVLATFSENLIELGKNSKTSVIKLCGGNGTITSKPTVTGGNNYSVLELSSITRLHLAAPYLEMRSDSGNDIVGYINTNSSSDLKQAHAAMSTGIGTASAAYLSLSSDSSSSVITILTNGSSSSNETTFSPNETTFAKRIVLANNQALRGATADGQTLSMVHMSSNDTVVLGYGSYTTGIGKTVLSGNGLEFLVKTAGTRYKPYYEADLEDGEVDTWRVNGLVTTSKTQIVFMIPLGKPVIGNPTITITSMNGLEIRQNGKYTHGSASNKYIIPDSYKAALVGGNCIHVTATVSDTTNAINNETCFIRANISIEFS